MERILQVVTYMDVGGIESFLMNLYRNINREVIQFDFLMHREVPTYFDAEIESLGGRIYRLPPIRPDTFLRYRAELARFFREHPEYRTIHCHNNAYSMFVLREAKKHGVPVRIAHSHSAFPRVGLVKRITQEYCRTRICRYTTHRFACSEVAGQWLYCGESFERFPNAIQAGKYRFSEQTRQAARRELGLGEHFTIMHVGRFDAAKNQAFLLEVFAHLLEKEPEARLVLIGDGPLRAELQSRAEQTLPAGAVIFTGIRSDVPDLLQAADVFAFPSVYEGLGIVLIEAQASGLPCIKSDTITDEVCVTDLAASLPLGDPSPWVEAILDRRSTLRRDTYEHIAAAGYDIAAAAETLTRFYLNGAQS